MATNDRPVGLLVVRTWHEGSCLRARVTCAVDIAKGTPTVRVVATGEEIRSVVAQWLAQVAVQAQEGEPEESGRSAEGAAD